MPRALRGRTRDALAGEATVALAVVSSDPADDAVSALAVTGSRLLLVNAQSTQSWRLSEVGVGDFQEQSTGNRAALSLLAGGEIQRFLMPRGYDPTTLREAYLALRALNNEAVALQLSELAWWELKAAWPYAAQGRVAGGAPPLTPGEKSSLGVGRRGVSIYPYGQEAPTLQLPWQDVTSIVVETIDELRERISELAVTNLNLLSADVTHRGAASFASVSTRNQELYFALEAPAEDLRRHWSPVLAHFVDDPVEDAMVADVLQVPEADLVSRLERLNALHESGALTQAEFEAAKAVIIGGR